MTDHSTAPAAARAGRPWTPAQRFALAFGVVYGAVAVAGFALTGFHGLTSHEHATLVVFAVNPLHNVIHAVLAVAAPAGAFRARSARLVDVGLGVALGLVTVLGLLGWLGMLGMSGLADPDNFLHLSTAALALYFGSVAVDQATTDDESADLDLFIDNRG
jgi:small-conductance mechanosensitive channel